MEVSILENFLVEVQGMKEDDARLKVSAELETIEAEYKEYQLVQNWKLLKQNIKNIKKLEKSLGMFMVLQKMK